MRVFQFVRVVVLCASGLLGAAAGCGGGDDAPGDGDGDGDGGSPGPGGSSGSGGKRQTGGSLGDGGEDALGGQSAAGGTSELIELEIGSVKPVYAGTKKWNARVSSTGPLALQGTDTACPEFIDVTTLDPSYANCIHGGIVRGAVVNRDDCEGLSAEDALGAFTWTCDETDGVRFVATGFAPEKSLRDLIDFKNAAFLENAVTVTDAGANESAATESEVWWDNVVIAADATTTLDTEWGVYVYADDPEGAVAVGSKGVTVVTAPGVAITTDGPNNSVTLGLFSYFSGDVVSSNSQSGVFSGTARPMIHDTKVTFVAGGGPDNGILLATGARGAIVEKLDVEMLDAVDGEVVTLGNALVDNGGGSLLRDVRLRGGQRGLDAGNSGGGHIIRLKVVDARYGYVSGTRQVIEQAVILGGERPVADGGSDQVWLQTLVGLGDINFVSGEGWVTLGLTSAFSERAFQCQGCEAGGTAGQHLWFNNGWSTLNNGTNNFWFQDLVMIGSSLNSAGAGHHFTGELVVDVTSSCNDNGGWVAGTCTASGDYGSSDYGVTNTSDAVLSKGADGSGTFVGLVTSDATNPDHEDGLALASSISDWLNFDNRLRAWVTDPDGAALTDAALRDSCDGDCALFDFSLSSSDLGNPGPSGDDEDNRPVALGLNTAPTGGDTRIHRWMADESNCARISGAIWDADAGECSSTFLFRAQELMIDGVGNDNGLCESGENCLWLQNAGAYQGHGALEPVSFTAGTVSGVKLFTYAQQGR